MLCVAFLYKSYKQEMGGGALLFCLHGTVTYEMSLEKHVSKFVLVSRSIQHWWTLIQIKVQQDLVLSYVWLYP